jgi:hypothetical protein
MLALIVLSILGTWLFMAAVCIGIGSLLLRFLDSSGGPLPRSIFRPSDVPTFQRTVSFSLLDAFWTGVALIVAILQLYHFVRPIDTLIVSLVSGLALAGLLWNSSSFFRRVGDFSQPSYFIIPGLSDLVFLVLAVSVAAVIVALRAAGPCEHYDTGLYGAQAVRWFITYPIVPGLGNVIAQIGFNSSVFLWIGALDQGPWRNLAHHLFVGFLMAALFASIIPAVLRIFRGKNISSVHWFLTLLFIPGAISAAMGKISGANTDLPTTIVCLVAASMVFRALDGEDLAQNTHGASEAQDMDKYRRMSLIIAMLLFALAVTFKISSIVFAFSGWTLAAVKLWSLSWHGRGRKWVLGGAVILSGAIVLPWICRGLILTGYPFFPSTALGISVGWGVPAAIAQFQAEFARSFARIPQIPLADTQGFHWLGPWLRELVREREGFVIPLFFALAGGLAAIVRIARERRAALPQWLWLLVPASAGLIIWFGEAPAMRFGEPILWTAGATLGTFAALHFLGGPGHIAKMRVALAALFLMTAWAAHLRLLWGSYFRPSITVRTFLRLPEARVVPHQTSSGLTIYIPADSNQCWDAPLPCSPYFSETLRMRRPGKLENGFVSIGAVPGMKVFLRNRKPDEFTEPCPQPQFPCTTE